MAALHLLFLLFLAVAASSNNADQPLTQQEVCMASSSSSCPDDVEPNKEEATVSFRHYARTINVDLVLPASNRAVAAGDEDLQLRQEAMAKAITVLSRHSTETTDAETLKRPIFRAVNRVLESGADDRTKEEAFAAAKVQLNSELGQEEKIDGIKSQPSTWSPTSFPGKELKKNEKAWKDYEGSTGHSEMVFNNMEAWASVKDLPLNKRTDDSLGDWLGEIVKVDLVM
ncbi:unnamed protein product [Triticum turgidum subsp. durum]|uniref:rRNA N-glycosidase n=1 Tax=Triticum turgidum subsp. durum TaxID=4567 RepID=A0A9R1QYT7_TRITD|nr:unnamed protein product [Triticum turgidum subsp. durum]